MKGDSTPEGLLRRGKSPMKTGVDTGMELPAGFQSGASLLRFRGALTSNRRRNGAFRGMKGVSHATGVSILAAMKVRSKNRHFVRAMGRSTAPNALNKMTVRRSYLHRCQEIDHARRPWRNPFIPRNAPFRRLFDVNAP